MQLVRVMLEMQLELFSIMVYMPNFLCLLNGLDNAQVLKLLTLSNYTVVNYSNLP